jgi:hypothetical protein
VPKLERTMRMRCLCSVNAADERGATAQQLKPVQGFQSDYGRGLSAPSISSACGFRWLAAEIF